MKFSHVTSLVLVGLGAAAGCSQGSLPEGTAGTSGSGAQSGMGTTTGGVGGGTGATGGTTGGVGGTTGGTGGTTGGAGGASGSGTTVGGGAGMAMSVGGATGATAGAGGGAGVGMAAGGSAGTGMAGVGGTDPGAGGTGGMSAGGAPPMGGTSSMGGGGAGGGGGLTPEEIVPGLNGFYWEGTCSGNPAVTSSSGHNCPMTGTATSLPTGGINREQSIDVKGTSGQVYTINIEVRGVIGTRCYTGGTRAASAALNENGNNNWWYIGGSYANPTGWWNTYELHVSPSTGEAPGDVFYFNGSGVQGGNDCEREATYLVKYNASFKAKGGGKLTFKIHDENGKGQQNCGSNPDGSSTCAPRMVDLTGMAATPPNFTQPPQNQLEKTYYPQWMVIAVTSITSP